jgi:hypothetical protein
LAHRGHHAICAFGGGLFQDKRDAPPVGALVGIGEGQPKLAAEQRARVLIDQQLIEGRSVQGRKGSPGRRVSLAPSRPWLD